MYPNPRRRFCTSSFEVLLSSGGIIFLISFSSMWITNSSTDSYPAASEHCFTFSSSSPSIFTLCDPNIHPPCAVPSLRSRARRVRRWVVLRDLNHIPLFPALQRWANLGRPSGADFLGRPCGADFLHALSSASQTPTGPSYLWSL